MYTFICTPAHEWYCKITTLEQLLCYWDNVFNPRMRKALDSIRESKEFGRGMSHCDTLQALIGFKWKANPSMGFEEAHDDIVYDTRKAQYQALSNYGAIYINKKMGWNWEPKETEQFIHKNEFTFPVMAEDKLKIEQFPLGTHWYVFIDGVQLRKEDNLKFDTYDEAYEFAKEYLPQTKRLAL